LPQKLADHLNIVPPGGFVAVRSPEPHVELPLVCRRLTIDLEQPDKPAEVTSLMQDDSSYVQTELPRVNPAHKGRAYR
jgi:hypothetical protein